MKRIECIADLHYNVINKLYIRRDKLEISQSMSFIMLTNIIDIGTKIPKIMYFEQVGMIYLGDVIHLLG
jgi:hypothetical protein